MLIGIDARFYSESGVGRYLRNLIGNLKELDKTNQYIIFLLPKDYAGFEETENFKKNIADYKWYGFAEQFNLPKQLNKYELDLVHFPHFNVPIFYSGKFVVTIHDLIHQHHQMSRATTLNPITFKIKQIGYRRVFKNAAVKSQKILVPSKTVRKLLIEEWKVPSNKIIVTQEGVDANLLSVGRSIKTESINKTLTKFKIDQPYLFYVGNAHPHKNLEGLIKSFLIIQKKYPELLLVLSGQDHYFWQRLKKENNHKNIIYTGFIDDTELVALYKKAQALVIPSFEEGFGIPLLEAFALDCPVVCSKAGSLREVGGNACLYFDPTSTNELVEKINQVLSDPQIRKKLIINGKKRLTLFSWRKLAQKTLEVYSECK